MVGLVYGCGLAETVSVVRVASWFGEFRERYPNECGSCGGYEGLLSCFLLVFVFFCESIFVSEDGGVVGVLLLFSGIGFGFF